MRLASSAVPSFSRLFAAAFVASSVFAVAGCTAGGVAVQGSGGLLIPAVGYEVSYTVKVGSACKTFDTTTGSTGQFAFYGLKGDGSVNPKTYVPSGKAYVYANDPAQPANGKKYIFQHSYDTTCDLGGGETVACSKDLLMLSYSYDELSGNAPDPDVHVRFPASPAQDSDWAQFFLSCNLM